MSYYGFCKRKRIHFVSAKIFDNYLTAFRESYLCKSGRKPWFTNRCYKR